MAAVPKINQVFEMLLPIILPKIMVSLLLKSAVILTKSSGNEVPKANSVIPTMMGGSSSRFAMSDEASIT